jgi:hypothetical protein
MITHIMPISLGILLATLLANSAESFTAIVAATMAICALISPKFRYDDGK